MVKSAGDTSFPYLLRRHKTQSYVRAHPCVESLGENTLVRACERERASARARERERERITIFTPSTEKEIVAASLLTCTPTRWSGLEAFMPYARLSPV
jgi:hypothetical protein